MTCTTINDSTLAIKDMETQMKKPKRYRTHRGQYEEYNEGHYIKESDHKVVVDDLERKLEVAKEALNLYMYQYWSVKSHFARDRVTVSPVEIEVRQEIVKALAAINDNKGEK